MPPLDWWRGFRSQGIDRDHRRGARRQSRHRRGDRPHRAGRRAVARRRRGAVAECRAQRQRHAFAHLAVDSAGGTTGSLGGSERDLLSASLTASYEIDFWGKNRSALRAAEETAVASRYDREVVGLTTVVATANAYFQVLAAQDRLRVARENIASATRVLNLIKQRFAAGTASALDIAQQESLVNTQRAAIPPLEQTLTQNRNALARADRALARKRAHPRRQLAQHRHPRVTPGLPSELLAQRPDIREAEAKLAAANANVDNARAQMLPSITLTGEGGYQSAILQDAAAAGIGVLHSRRRPDPADLRRRPAARQSRPAKGPAGRTAAELPQGGDLRRSPTSRTRSTASARPRCASGCSATW